MAVEDYLSGSNLGYIGGAVGIVVAVIIIWSLIRKSAGDRPSLARQMIGEDRQLRNLDIEVRQDENKIHKTAIHLYEAISQLRRNTEQHGISLAERESDYRTIVEALELLWKETTDVPTAMKLMEKISPMIDRYILDLQVQDPIIMALVSKIPELKTILHQHIITEYQLLSKKMGLLRKEYQQTATEGGTFNKAA